MGSRNKQRCSDLTCRSNALHSTLCIHEAAIEDQARRLTELCWDTNEILLTAASWLSCTYTYTAYAYYVHKLTCKIGLERREAVRQPTSNHEPLNVSLLEICGATGHHPKWNEKIDDSRSTVVDNIHLHTQITAIFKYNV